MCCLVQQDTICCNWSLLLLFLLQRMQACFIMLLLYQSTNPPNNQPTNLPTNQPTYQSTYLPTNQLTYQPIHQQTNLSGACKHALSCSSSTNLLTNYWNLPTDLPNILPTNQTTYLPTQPTTNKSVQVAMTITEYRTGDHRSAAPDFFIILSSPIKKISFFLLYQNTILARHSQLQ